MSSQINPFKLGGEGMRLYLNSASDFTIRDDEDNIYTLEEARQLGDEGKLEDTNQAFLRLVRYDFDLEKVKEYYRI